MSRSQCGNAPVYISPSVAPSQPVNRLAYECGNFKNWLVKVREQIRCQPWCSSPFATQLPNAVQLPSPSMAPSFSSRRSTPAFSCSTTTLAGVDGTNSSDGRIRPPVADLSGPLFLLQCKAEDVLVRAFIAFIVAIMLLSWLVAARVLLSTCLHLYRLQGLLPLRTTDIVTALTPLHSLSLPPPAGLGLAPVPAPCPA